MRFNAETLAWAELTGIELGFDLDADTPIGTADQHAVRRVLRARCRKCGINTSVGPILVRTTNLTPAWMAGVISALHKQFGELARRANCLHWRVFMERHGDMEFEKVARTVESTIVSTALVTHVKSLFDAPSPSEHAQPSLDTYEVALNVVRESLNKWLRQHVDTVRLKDQLEVCATETLKSLDAVLRDRGRLR